LFTPYLVAIELPEGRSGLLDRVLGLLSPERQQKLRSFRILQDTYRSLIGEICVRLEAYKEIGMPPSQFELVRDCYGKPSLKQHPDFHFNISHAGRWVVCVFAPYRIGVDVEYCKPITMEIADRYFAPSEYESLINRPIHEQQLAFYKLWTQKESYMKAMGKGLSIPLNKISITNLGEEQFLIDCESERQMFAQQISIEPPDYLCCVCGYEKQLLSSVQILDVYKMFGDFMELS
jgi:4'-phosphopantetheinyl transferase